MHGNGQLKLLLGSIGALSAGLVIVWLTYCATRYVLSDLKDDYAKLRAETKTLAGISARAREGLANDV